MRRLIKGNNIILLATGVLLLALFLGGSASYRGFFSTQVVFNLFIDNAYLIIVATGVAFVIIGGGIDLSVGALVAFITMISAYLLKIGVNEWAVIGICLGIGVAFGYIQGFLITRFKLHSWIVTLGGMFFARGACYLISTESIVIENSFYNAVSKFKVRIFDGYISVSVILALLTVTCFIYISKYTQFGRNVYAVGGNEKSALLMGLPVNKVKVYSYCISGFCTALGGITFTFYTLSGYALHCVGMEMEAIAANVIGGILLTGGYGYLLGPMLGVLSSGLIQTIVIFQGNLSSWWTKIAVGFLLFVFILIQRLIVSHNGIKKSFQKKVKKIELEATKFK